MTSFHERGRWRQNPVYKLLSRNRLRDVTLWNADIHTTFTIRRNRRSRASRGDLESGIVIGLVHKLFTAAFVSLAGRGGAWESGIFLSRFFPARAQLFR